VCRERVERLKKARQKYCTEESASGDNEPPSNQFVGIAKSLQNRQTMLKSGLTFSARAFRAKSARCYGVWAWGTSKNGTIPTPEIHAEEQRIASGGESSSTSSATSLLDSNNRTKVLDHPHHVNARDVFGGMKGLDNNDFMVQDFACGVNNSAVVLDNGSCFVWGSNDNGQLGLGSGPTAPKEVTLPRSLCPPEESVETLSWLTNVEKGVKKIRLGKLFSAVIDADDDLHTFGYGGSALGGMGWLGHGDGESRAVPTLVESLREDGCLVKDVSLGENHMVVLTTEGEVLTGVCVCVCGFSTADGTLSLLDLISFQVFSLFLFFAVLLCPLHYVHVHAQ
jgi:hypothetical protein